MACIIEEMNRGLNPHFQETHPKPETPAPFYVFSNRSGINGAACILYEDVLKNFADGVEKNLIILPSSIHEVLLLPDDGDISYEEMSRLPFLALSPTKKTLLLQKGLFSYTSVRVIWLL